MTLHMSMVFIVEDYESKADNVFHLKKLSHWCKWK